MIGLAFASLFMSDLSKGISMRRKLKNYSQDGSTEENINHSDKYTESGESEYTRESTIPFDQSEVLSERHYTWSPLELYGRKHLRRRELLPAPQESFRGRGPKNYRRSDEKIKDDVSECLYRCTDVDASDIEILVSDGIVTLRGTVKTREQKKRAEAVIEHIAGVIDVLNEIHLKETAIKPSPFGLIDNITGLN